MTSNSEGFWQALEAIPGGAAVDAEWKALIGPDYEHAKAFLRPNGKIASSHPCTVQRGCGCHHDVVIHAPEDIVAVCRCGRGCETFQLKPSDIVVYEINRQALDSTLATTLGLFEKKLASIDLSGTTRIGVYSPYAGFRFPVYMTFQVEPDDFTEILDGILARSEGSFILLSPTRDLCDANAEKRLSDKKSCFIPLSEFCDLGIDRQIKLLRPFQTILEQFNKANLPPKESTDGMVFFPTPPDASWGDVEIHFRDGHTVSIKAKKKERGRFSYSQMGMASMKNAEPTLQWDLLRTFAKERGILTWDSRDASRKNQKRREQLSKDLRRFFRIDGDPIYWDPKEKGWRTRFRLQPEN